MFGFSLYFISYPLLSCRIAIYLLHNSKVLQMKKIFKSLGLCVPTHYCGDKFINWCKRNLILWKLNSIQMKILNDITSNLNWIELKYIEGNLNSIIRRKRPRCTILFVIAYNYMSLQPFWQLLTNIGNFWSF